MLTIPTFVIGLGGLGNAVVRLLRERFLTTETGGVPESVFLRSIDTAEETNQATRAERLPTKMYTRLGEFDAGQVVTHLENYPHIARWWRYPSGAYAPGFIDNGAGARRPVGRLCFFQQFNRIQEALANDFRQAISVDMLNKLAQKGLGDVARTPRVFIVGSLAGGTCAGMFIDVAILARELLSRRGYEPAGTRISGLFALPSVVHLATNDADAVAGRQRRINAYAALQELDFLLARKDALSVHYPEPIGLVSTNDALFNMVTLFTDTKDGGHAFTRQDEVLIRAAHFLYAQIAQGTRENLYSDRENLSSVRENLNTIIDNEKEFLDPSQQHTLDGQPATYCTFGVEWLEIPRQQLLQTWCQGIAARVGKLVADFDWETEHAQSLDRVILKNLPETFRAYSVAFRLRGAAAEDLYTFPEMAVFSQLLNDIGTAEKPVELARALDNFELAAPDLGAVVVRASGKLPEPAEEQAWLNGLVENLVASPEFRIGGARRLMIHLAEKLETIVQASPHVSVSRNEVERDCRRGLFNRNFDTSAALAWARQRIAQVAFERLRSAYGDHGARLAQQCTLRAERLATLQDLVRQETKELDLTREPAAVNLSPELWLIEPEAINQAVKANLEDVTNEVAQGVAAALGQYAAASFQGTASAASDGAVRAQIRKLVVEWTELAAVRKTKRPADTAARLQKRMAACRPLVHTVDEGTELIDVMGQTRRSVSVKMVVTGIDPKEQVGIDAWARKEKESAGNDNAFQVISSNDPLRDDVLNVEIGWPLCLMREVKTCARIFESVRIDDPHRAAFTFTMREVPGIETHGIMPRNQERVQDMFALAWVLDHLKIELNPPMMSFSLDVFGQCEPVFLSPGETVEQVLEKGRERFRLYGLLPKYERYFGGETSNSRPSFRARMQAAVVIKRANIEELQPRTEFRDLLKVLEQYCARVEKLSRDIVDL